MNGYTYLGEYFGYHLYRNNDNFIEGYKEKGSFGSKKNNINRIVTNTTEISEFPNFIIKKEKPIKYYNPYDDPNQLKIE